MKYIQLIIITAVVISCSNENKPELLLNSKTKVKNETECISELFNEIDSSKFKIFKKQTVKREWEIYQSIDSLNYEIERRWRRNKKPIWESVRNTTINIEICKEYYKNGVLRSEGYMTSIKGTPIGKWNYYSNKGNLDSTVNYERRYGVSFCEFYKLCKQRNLLGHSSSIGFINKERKWRITKYEDVDGSPIFTGIELQVDSNIVREYYSKGIY